MLTVPKKIATYSALDKAKCIIEFDQNGNIIAANSNFLNAMGYKIGEIKGKHHSIFLDPDYANSDMYKNFWQQLKEGKSQNADFKRYGKNSKEVCLQASYLPIKNIFGKTSRIIKYADLAGQIEAINKSQAVIEFDTDGTIITANSIFLDLMGYTIHEIQGKHHSIFVEKNYSLS